MPLDKVLINHLDEQDVLEDNIENDIDKLVNGLSISQLMDGAEDALMNIVETLQEVLKDGYYPQSSESGIRLAKDIEKDGDIQIPDSNNPSLNEDLLDGISGESQS